MTKMLLDNTHNKVHNNKSVVRGQNQSIKEQKEILLILTC